MSSPSSHSISVENCGVRTGDILAGKYRIDRVLGAGGMGVVVAAHHIELDDRVAIKFLLPEALDNAEAVARFAREARAATRIKSQYVARVSDVGKLESGAPYMVMEYLEGQDLSAMLQERRALPVHEVAEFVVQACDAIAEAHSLGVVHRDLKPANLFCVRGADGLLSVKVLDFGISKVTTLGGFDMTRTAALMGSPLYMSPEQMTSAKDVDARTDIWSLGVVLYELIAGRPPFQGETLPELVLDIATKEPQPLRNFRTDLPDGLEAVVLRCLAKDRTARYQNVAEFAVDLVEFAPRRTRVAAERVSRIIHASGLSASALALPPSSATAPPPAAGTVASWGHTGTSHEERPRGRGTLVAAAVAALVVASIGAGAFITRARPGVAATAAASVTTESPAPAVTSAAPTVAPDIARAVDVAPVDSAPAQTLVATDRPTLHARAAAPAANAHATKPAKSAAPAPTPPLAPAPKPAHTAPAKPAHTSEFGGRL